MQLYDASIFSFWLDATSRKDSQAVQLFERRFRPEFRPAFAAWQRTHPFTNPNAPPGPQAMPQYRNTTSVEADRLDRRATATFAAGTEARKRGDEYVRATVLLATVLVLTALAQRFKFVGVRLSLLGVAAVLLVFGLVLLATYPRA